MVGGGIVLIDSDVGVVVFGESSSGALDAYVSWLDGGIQLDRVNGEHIIFFIYVMDRNRYMINQTCEVVGFNDINCRLTVLIDWVNRIRY